MATPPQSSIYTLLHLLERARKIALALQATRETLEGAQWPQPSA